MASPRSEATIAASLLSHFGARLTVADALGCVAAPAPSAAPTAEVVRVASPETALGHHLALLQRRTRLVDRVRGVLAAKKAGRQLTESLTAWLAALNDSAAVDRALAFADQWLAREGAFDADIRAVLDARSALPKRSLWVVVGAEDARDLAGIHHFLAAGEDINLLVLVRAATSPSALPRRDVGLYALNYGGVFVASSSPVTAFEQFKTAISEADAFVGPSVVVALVSDDAAAAAAAVDAGEWPLYRWNPSLESTATSALATTATTVEGGAASPPTREPFTLDSVKLRKDLAAFLDKEAHLTLLARATPVIDAPLVESLEATAAATAAANASRLQASFSRLMGAVELPPLHVLFGSDGGNAEGLAKRVASEARAKGFTSVTCCSMDALGATPEALASVRAAVFFVSVAGQGEFPQNARAFAKSLETAAGPLPNLSYAVFGLGDSNYWPRKEQRIFYNKAGVDLDAHFTRLGATRLLELGLGDDQSTGGYQADFRKWVPSLWGALGVGTPGDDGSGGAPRLRHPEDIKATSNFLRGTILQGLSDTTTGALAYEDTLLTKFHGIYQQDERDLRADRKRAGLEPAYSFMVRVRIPGGVATCEQYLALDRIADAHANGTIRVTTRQAVQFHGIVKAQLKPSIAAMNRALMDTIAACGDVNRNVMCTPNPRNMALHAPVVEFSKRLSDHLTPATSAYHEIWMDEKLVGGGSVDVEPIYGPTYLPRKFKIAVAIPPHNDVDVFAHDLGFIAVEDASGGLAGFTVTVGGGMGTTHNAPATFPRLGEPFCFATPEECLAIAEAIVTTQRDFGDRVNRKHARFKYTVDDRGLPWLWGEVEARAGFALQPPRPFAFTSNGDALGWTEDTPGGTWSYTLFVQNGRVKDTGVSRLKTGLAAIARTHKGDIRFTANQNVIIAACPLSERGTIESLLVEYGIDNKRLSGLRLNSMACVALPTCGLALAESERYLPSLVEKLETVLEEAGLHSEAITIRMTGCPNGCARPFVAEIGFVGRSPGIYNVYLGAGFHGERLNKLHKESLGEEEILQELSPIIKRYAREKMAGEHFGDWCVRAGVIKPTLSGRTFHDL